MGKISWLAMRKEDLAVKHKEWNWQVLVDVANPQW